MKVGTIREQSMLIDLIMTYLKQEPRFSWSVISYKSNPDVLPYHALSGVLEWCEMNGADLTEEGKELLTPTSFGMLARPATVGDDYFDDGL